jgi:hypothetical protein
MVVSHAALAGDRLSNRNAVINSELCNRGFRTRVSRPASGDNERAAGGLKQPNRLFDTTPVGSLARNVVHRLLEES